MTTEISNHQAAEYGIMVMHAMDMYRVDVRSLDPKLPQPALNAGWVLLGHVIGTDHLIDKNRVSKFDQTVCYGYVARREKEVVVAIRGTDQFVEWIEDAKFIPDLYAPLEKLPAAPPGIKVEQGFWSIYQTMRFRRADSTQEEILHTAVAAQVGPQDTVAVTGHSLGAPLATYLTIELARGNKLNSQLSGCFFASPHPGNHAFATYFDHTVDSYRVFNYILDVVPRVPIGPDYTHLPRRTVLRPSTAQASITMRVGCNHHVICYSAMLDYEVAKPFKDNPPPGEEGSAVCVIGPEIGRPTLSKLLMSGLGEIFQV